MAFIALVAVLLLSGFAAHEGRKGLTSLAIMLGVFALIACGCWKGDGSDLSLRTISVCGQGLVGGAK